MDKRKKGFSGNDSLAIFFIAGMEEDVLIKMFGYSIYHNDFGEGFIGEYDEDKEEYGDPVIKESYASYMIEIHNYVFHIGYDHRGTRIEVEPDINVDMLLDCLKELSKLYIKTDRFI
jgi:hypothetical protein